MNLLPLALKFLQLIRCIFIFKPIFDPPLKKIVRRPLSPVGGALVRLGHSLARVKIWGRSTS